MNRRLIRRLGLSSLAFAFAFPIAACGTREKPPVIDLTTPIKSPVAPKSTKAKVNRPAR
ncbi:hypothetical protein P12x_002703 [Tundrisphaera lichenicola]|uniref:hypothetical protein n=1 Tax=Tundrisphaera lichenicola TaxID=2029860 RepID=UPI003EB7EA25